MNEVSALISSLGFPIAAAIGLSIYVIRKEKSTEEKEKIIIKTMTDAHERESAKLSKVIERNTQALAALAEQIKKITK